MWKNYFIRLFVGIVFTICSSVVFANKSESSSKNYFSSIKQELVRLEVNAICNDGVATCVYKKQLKENEKPFDIRVRYSKTTSTVHIVVERFLEIKNEEGISLALAKRLLELNKEMICAKFDLNNVNNSVRLSTIINTDSNFDRAAFRSQLVGIWKITEKLWPELNGSFGQ